MSSLKDILPDLTSESVALDITRRAVRKTGEDAALNDYLKMTATVKEEVVYYRPYAAARAWLKAHPRWLEEAESAHWRSLDEALAGLAESQAMLDAALDLPVNKAITPSIGVPGPNFVRLFGGK